VPADGRFRVASMCKQRDGSEAFLVENMKAITPPTLSASRPFIEGSTFEEFYLRHHRDVYAGMWLVTRDRHEAEEVTQDAFLKLLERWDRVGSMDDPTGYLFATAMNVWRSRRRRAAVALRRTIHLTERERPNDLDQAESRADVVRILSVLTPRQRAALVLVDLVGLTSEEAADALGIRPSTVRVQAARARASLKEGMSR
jgi:RNA polymerase sigma-70 factor (ECF subfamily)